MYYDWKPYVSAARRRLDAVRELEKLRKKGRAVSPVIIEGRAIARTFWGKSWCTNLERYSDYANRLPRGRSYVRNGSVVDLQVKAGEVSARVSGSSLYEVSVSVAAVPKTDWAAICRDCTGAIDSLVELLQGRFSQSVMDRICQEKKGLFPTPGEIQFDCSCPDWASMCKHVAAVLYGIGARLDEKPEVLFLLRKVNEEDLLRRAGKGMPLTKKRVAAEKVLDGAALSELFGIEMDRTTKTMAHDPARKGRRAATARASQGKPGAKATRTTDRSRRRV
jgi:uncharacterized Zn finger protein